MAAAVTAGAAQAAPAHKASRWEALWAEKVDTCLREAGVDTAASAAVVQFRRRADGRLRLVAAPDAAPADKAAARECIARGNAAVAGRKAGKRVIVRRPARQTRR